MKPRSRSSGMALMTAILLIVVLIGLGLAVMNLSNVESDTTSKSYLGAKVYYGAKAGLDWGIQQAIGANGACAASTVIPLTQQGLNGVSVTVTCVSAPQGASTCGLSGAATCATFYITSTASTGAIGNASYAQRLMQATVSNIP